MTAGWRIVGTAGWRNLAAWAVGSLLALAIFKWKPPAAGPLLLAPILLAASFADRGQLGVHRWLTLGPLHWNASFLVLPAVCVAVALRHRRARWTWWAAILCGALLAAQPDASQATAFAASMMVISLRTRAGLPAAATLAVLAVAAWFRPDPLAPVPEVEGIIGLAWRASPALAVFSVFSLAAVCAAPLLHRHRIAAEALCTYLAVVSLTPLAGAFPVPLVGVGMSPVLGFALAAGLLANASDPESGGER